MRLQEAIEIKQLALDTGIVNDPHDFRIADKLSIKAMDRLETLRAYNIGAALDPLPGETKE